MSMIVASIIGWLWIAVVLFLAVYWIFWPSEPIEGDGGPDLFFL